MSTTPPQFADCCQHCGTPLTKGGYALACGPGGGRIKLPDYCADRECAKARDDAAIARAIAAGIIDP